MTRFASLVLILACAIFGSTTALADPPDGATPATPPVAPDNDTLELQNPNDIAERYRVDRERKESLFEFPGSDLLIRPWSSLRDHLDETYGFRPGISFTHLYQNASDTVGPEDDASGFELVIDGTWDILGRNTDSPTKLGFEFLYRDIAGTEIPPVALFGQAGSLYPTSVAFAEVGPALGQLWIEQKFGNSFGIRAGKFFPVAAYDFFPLKNFRTDFVDGIHAANLVIPLPDRGLGAFVMWRPQPNVYIRAGVHDANADAERSGFEVFDEGELFYLVEAGFDPGLMERQPGRPPSGDVHVTFWGQDEREDLNIEEARGVAVSGSQRWGRFLPFLRYGYSDGGENGPTAIEHLVNGGVAIDDIFGQENDRIGIGLTWARPSDPALGDQVALDCYYRLQVTPRLAVTPILQVILDPVRNPSEDQIAILGIRSRVAF